MCAAINQSEIGMDRRGILKCLNRLLKQTNSVCVVECERKYYTARNTSEFITNNQSLLFKIHHVAIPSMFGAF